VLLKTKLGQCGISHNPLLFQFFYFCVSSDLRIQWVFDVLFYLAYFGCIFNLRLGCLLQEFSFFCYKAHLLLLFLLSSFCFQWEDRMDKGLFRYDVTACETMVTFLNTHLFTLQPRIMVTCFMSIYCLNSMYLSRQWISFHIHLEYLL
jgi:hypothetical protein